MFHVGLIFPEVAVIYRLDQPSTWAQDPPGTPSAGYDPILREPYVYRASGVRATTRQEMAPISVPCQYSTMSEYRLRMIFTGDAPVTNSVLILDREDMRNLSLLDATTGECTLKPGDRLDHLESKAGVVTRTFNPHLFIYEVRTGSHGFGRDGYDLYNVFLSHRSPTVSGA